MLASATKLKGFLPKDQNSDNNINESYSLLIV